MKRRADKSGGKTQLSPTLTGLWIGALALPVLWREPRGYLLFMLAAAAVHEAGHLLAFLLCGRRVPRFSLRAFGFLLTPQGAPLSFREELAVAAGGPLFNLLSACALIPALRAGVATEANFCFFALNLLTGMLNLLPVNGFDGGRVLQSGLFLLFPSHIAEGIAGGASLLSSLLFYFFSLFFTFVAGGHPFPLILSLFLLFSEYRRRPFLFEDFGEIERKRKIFAKKCKNPKAHCI